MAAIAPVASVVPVAVAQLPTTTSAAVPARTMVTVVVAEVVTTTGCVATDGGAVAAPVAGAPAVPAVLAAPSAPVAGAPSVPP